MTEGAQGRLRDLHTLTLQMYELEREQERLARSLRFSGVSWGLIGWALGMTPAGAARKYGG